METAALGGCTTWRITFRPSSIWPPPTLRATKHRYRSCSIGHPLQLEGDDILLDYVEHQLHWRQLWRIGWQNSGDLKFFYLDDKILSFISHANIINITNFRDFKSLINVINFIKSNPYLFLLKLAFEFLLKFLQFPLNHLFHYMFLFQ